MCDAAGSMLSMLECLCTELMESEVDQQLGAEKSQRTEEAATAAVIVLAV